MRKIQIGNGLCLDLPALADDGVFMTLIRAARLTANDWRCLGELLKQGECSVLISELRAMHPEFDGGSLGN